MFNPLSLITSALGVGKSVLDGWQKRKTAKTTHELELAKAVNEAKIARVRTSQAADIAWENTSIKNAGWKDEFWTLVLSIPCIMCFIPAFAPYVTAGFLALAACPEWYKWALLVAISSSFGYKKLADFMSLKKGDKFLSGVGGGSDTDEETGPIG